LLEPSGGLPAKVQLSDAIHADQSHETNDVRTGRVSDPFEDSLL